jgi:hypothetical protein
MTPPEEASMLCTRLIAFCGVLLASVLAIPTHAGDKPKMPTAEELQARYVRVGSVVVPDGGSAAVAGVATLAAGRNEGGVPGLSKVPYAGRGFGNVGYGSGISKVGASISVRIIDLRAMDKQLLGTKP